MTTTELELLMVYAIDHDALDLNVEELLELAVIDCIWADLPLLEFLYWNAYWDTLTWEGKEKEMYGKYARVLHKASVI